MSLDTPATSPAFPDQALPPGTHLEEFTVEKVLGSGGFGITYLARDSRLGRQVVIKENLPVQFCWRDPGTQTVRPRHTQGEDADNFAYSLDSFEREAATLASLHHPGIVQVLRSFEARGTAYFVMPFVEGMALDEVLRKRTAEGRPFVEDEVRRILSTLLEALGYLHERGIYHRDIKPGNILITREGLPVLIDFGAARQRLGEKSLTVIESAGYTPFEQLQTHGNIGPWSDVYALGAAVCKLLTGETPPKAADRVLEDPLVPLASRQELLERFTQPFLASVDKALAPDARKRHPTSEAWQAELARGTSAPHSPEKRTPSRSFIKAPEPAGKPLAKPPRPPSQQPPKSARSGRNFAVGLIVVAVLASGGYWFAEQRRSVARHLGNSPMEMEPASPEPAIATEEDVQAAYDTLLATFYQGAPGIEDEGGERSIDILQKAAGREHPAAMHALSVFHMAGWGVEQDQALAFSLVEKAAKAGHAQAMNDLAFCLQEGIATPKNLVKAIEWYQKAEGLGNAMSMYHLGMISLEKKEDGEAFARLLKAAEAGVVAAMYESAECYAKGRGTPANALQAVRWHRKAAEQGDLLSAFSLAENLRCGGEGYPRDPLQALDYYKQAIVGSSETNLLPTAAAFENKLKTLKLPKVSVSGVHIDELLEYLILLSRDADSTEKNSMAKGVQILLLDTDQPIVASIDMDLEATTLGEALRILCDLLDLEMRLDAPGVLLSPKP